MIFSSVNAQILFFLFEQIKKASTPILEQAPENVTVLDGKDATIQCRAVGAPTPNITWIYNGELKQQET